MNFSEKLFKLRKEKDMSQEALAEKISTTRQAISKWENGQGFPETEKLMMLANILGVSIDYLLKEDFTQNEQDNDGYYVSKEKAQSWLWHESIISRRIGLGVFFLISVRIPFLLLSTESTLKWVFSILLAAIGLSIVLATCLNDRDYEYKPLKRYSLIFDKSYLVELKERYVILKKKYVLTIVTFIGIILLGAIGLILKNSMSDFGWIAYNVIYVIIFAISFGMLFHCFTMIDAYELLVYNEEYINKITTRFLNKLRNKSDNLFRE